MMKRNLNFLMFSVDRVEGAFDFIHQRPSLAGYCSSVNYASCEQRPQSFPYVQILFGQRKDR